MALPTREQWLEAIRRIRQDSVNKMEFARATGDKKLMRECEKGIARVDKMLAKVGERP